MDGTYAAVNILIVFKHSAFMSLNIQPLECCGFLCQSSELLPSSCTHFNPWNKAYLGEIHKTWVTVISIENIESTEHVCLEHRAWSGTSATEYLWNKSWWHLALCCIPYPCICRWIWPLGHTFVWCPRSLFHRCHPHSPCLHHISSVPVCRSHLWHSGIPLHCTQWHMAALKQKSGTNYP